MPLHCVSDPTLDRPSEPTNPVSPTHFPRNELFSGKHFARDFRIMLRREIVRKTNPRWETAPRVQEDKRRYLCEQITPDACSWEHILKPGRFEFLHEFHFIYFLSTIARLEWVFIWRDQPGQDWLARIYPIEHVQPGALSNISLFMVQNSGLMLRPLTLVNPLNSHHISFLCHAGVTQWCINSALHVMMSRSLSVTRVSWRMGRKC